MSATTLLLVSSLIMGMRAVRMMIILRIDTFLCLQQWNGKHNGSDNQTEGPATTLAWLLHGACDKARLIISEWTNAICVAAQRPASKPGQNNIQQWIRGSACCCCCQWLQACCKTPLLTV